MLGEESRVRSGAALALAAILLLASCQAATPGPTVSKTILRVGIQGYPESFNVNLDHNAAGYSMYRALFDKLTNADASKGGALGPELATSWSLVNDTTWRFKLREDVKWSDGTPFTADDVVATIDLTLNGKPPALMASRIDGTTGSEAVDKYTVDIHTKVKSAILPIGLADIFIYQAKQIKEGGNAAIQKTPVVTGMFRVTSAEPGVAITLERNPHYWGQKASIDEIVFKPYPEDATRMAALEKGEIDIAFNVPPDDAKRLRGKGISIQSVGIGQAMMLDFKTVNPNTPFYKKQVRQALNYAVDKDTIIRDVMLGFGEKLRGQVVGPDGVGFNDKLSAYPYDPAKAKKMLSDAGYANGFPVTFHTSEGRYVKQKEVSEAIAGYLRNVGLNVTMNVQDFSTFFQQIPTLDMFYAGWNYFPVMDADFDVQHFTCGSRFKMMCNQAYDQLFQQERAEPDAAKRAGLMQQMQAILYEEAPAVFMFQAPDIFGVGPRVKGFKPTPDDVVHFGGVSVEGGR